MGETKRVRTEYCDVCGEPEEEHHDYVPSFVKMPIKCKCDIKQWENIAMKNICNNYRLCFLYTSKMCSNCRHIKACHEE